MKKAVLLVGLVAAVWLGYQKLRDVNPDDLPQPTQVVVPDPPPITFTVPTLP